MVVVVVFVVAVAASASIRRKIVAVKLVIPAAVRLPPHKHRRPGEREPETFDRP